MDTPETYLAVCDKLREIRPGALIGIEGFCSSGKSTLADRLGTDIEADVIHTDTYAIKFDRPPNYVDCLKVDELAKALERRSATKRCIIEGICLREVLARCAAKADFYLYVKRMARNGLWHDAYHLEDFKSGNALNGIEPHLSDLSYHSRVRPHDLADSVFHWIEGERDV